MPDKDDLDPSVTPGVDKETESTGTGGATTGSFNNGIPTKQEILISLKQEGREFVPKNISEVKDKIDKVAKLLGQESHPFVNKVKGLDIETHPYTKIVEKGLRIGSAGSNVLGSKPNADRFKNVADYARPISEPEHSLSQKYTGLEDPNASEADSKFVRKLGYIDEMLVLGEEIAKLTGREDIAEILQELQGVIDPNELKGKNAKQIRATAANLAGNFAARTAMGKGKLGEKVAKKGLNVSRGVGKFAGGAVAGAMQGEGAGGIAKAGISWWALDILFVNLLTPWSPLALLALNIYFILSKFGFSWTPDMTYVQKIYLLVANALYIFVIAIFLGLLVVIGCNYPIGKVTDYKASVLGLSGFEQICQDIDVDISVGAVVGKIGK
jgi:hypothetical protein